MFCFHHHPPHLFLFLFSNGLNIAYAYGGSWQKGETAAERLSQGCQFLSTRSPMSEWVWSLEWMDRWGLTLESILTIGDLSIVDVLLLLWWWRSAVCGNSVRVTPFYVGVRRYWVCTGLTCYGVASMLSLLALLGLLLPDRRSLDWLSLI